MNDLTARSEYAKGLRALADILEASDAVPIPADGSILPLGISFWDKETAQAEMIAARRAIGGAWDKEVDNSYYRLRAKLHGLNLELHAYRDAVCTRVVTGTHEETVQEPVSYKSVTKTIEDVEWVCEPFLDDGQLLDVAL